MRVIITFFVLASVNLIAAPRYQCELKTRPNMMSPFEIQTKEFNGETPIEIRMESALLKFKTVLIDGNETLGLWLGTPSKEYSAVTLAEPGQKTVYLNQLNQDEFRVAECKILSKG